MSIVTEIVDGILDDVTDRRGWKQEWGQFDPDIKVEIRATWAKIIRQVLRKYEEE